MKRIAACGIALLSALVLAPGAASAEQRPARYILSITDEFAGRSMTTTLACNPVGGAHPRAEDACADIAEAGSIKAITSVGGICTMHYRPFTVTVRGHERFEQTFSNSCLMVQAKRSVFGFWNTAGA